MGNVCAKVADRLCWATSGTIRVWQSPDPIETEPLLPPEDVEERALVVEQALVVERAPVTEQRLRFYQCLSLPELVEERRQLDAREVAALSARWRAAVAAAEEKVSKHWSGSAGAGGCGYD